MPQTDNELINMAVSGDALAFDELVCRYDKMVLAIAVKYAEDNDDAKDIYQDVFIRVYRGLKKFKFESEFSTWLFRITTNVCLTYSSQKKKKKFVSIFNEEDEENESISGLQDQENTPEKFTASSEIFENINSAVNHLPPKQKMIFILKHFEGYKLREISEIMDIKEGTVKKYLFEAIRKLRESLKHYQDSYGT